MAAENELRKTRDRSDTRGECDWFPEKLYSVPKKCSANARTCGSPQISSHLWGEALARKRLGLLVDPASVSARASTLDPRFGQLRSFQGCISTSRMTDFAVDKTSDPIEILPAKTVNACTYSLPGTHEVPKTAYRKRSVLLAAALEEVD